MEQPPRRPTQSAEARVSAFQPKNVTKVESPDSQSIIVGTAISEAVASIQSKMGIRNVKTVRYNFMYEKEFYVDENAGTLSAALKLCSPADSIYAITIDIYDTYAEVIVSLRLRTMTSGVTRVRDAFFSPGVNFRDYRVNTFFITMEHFSRPCPEFEIKAIDQLKLTWRWMKFATYSSLFANIPLTLKKELIEGVEVYCGSGQDVNRAYYAYYKVNSPEIVFMRVADRSASPKRKNFDSLNVQTKIMMTVAKTLKMHGEILDADNLRNWHAATRVFKNTINELRDVLNDDKSRLDLYTALEDAMCERFDGSSVNNEVTGKTVPPQNSTRPSV